MNQIFLFLASLANVALFVTFYLGWRIEDAGLLSEAALRQTSMHFQFALASASFALLVHAVVLTYFMGTGRWIQETTEAYRFQAAASDQNIRLKYRVLPGMMACLLLIIVTCAFGAIADPASNAQMEHSATIHLTLALATVIINLLVSVLQYNAILKNTALVDLVYRNVLKVRQERGLDSPTAVDSPAATHTEQQDERGT